MSDERAFEDALAELEALVRRLEQGELPLEESLAAFERGMALVRQLGTRLDDVSQRVEVLLRAAHGRWGRGPLPPRSRDPDDESCLARRASVSRYAPPAGRAGARGALPAAPVRAPPGDPLQPPRRRQAAPAHPRP